MRLRRELRERNDTELAVLEALAERHQEGMTVFELRSIVDRDIDDLETALSGLQRAGLIRVEREDSRTLFLIADRALASEASTTTDTGFLAWLQSKLGR
ncbi:MAG: DUF6432 family protein [Halodesulfurarchaeum sp.]